jgi:2-polyprenyl-3-methyl-5-hydroxy-6-metoxy-1,4-benzoquinol methylase
LSGIKVNLLDNLLSECSKIIKKNILNYNNRLDLDSKVYFEGVKNDLILVTRYLPKKSKVLDIGVGKGIISVLMQSLGFIVNGIDLEETKGEQLGILEKRWQETIWKQFKNKFGVQYQFYDGSRIPFENDHFDAVVAYAVIEHVSEIDVLLKEINRVLKKKGFLFIFRCPRKWAIAEWVARFCGLPCHEKLLNEKQLLLQLVYHGFHNLKIERTDLIPAFPPKNFQNFWNFCSPILLLIEKILLQTPISILSHHIRLVGEKI